MAKLLNNVVGFALLISSSSGRLPNSSSTINPVTNFRAAVIDTDLVEGEFAL
jgi:hypothetical protein